MSYRRIQPPRSPSDRRRHHRRSSGWDLPGTERRFWIGEPRHPRRTNRSPYAVAERSASCAIAHHHGGASRTDRYTGGPTRHSLPLHCHSRGPLRHGWSLSRDREAYVLVADPRFGRIVHQYLQNLRAATTVHILVAGQDSLSAIPPEAPVYARKTTMVRCCNTRAAVSVADCSERPRATGDCDVWAIRWREGGQHQVNGGASAYYLAHPACASQGPRDGQNHSGEYAPRACKAPDSHQSSADRNSTNCPPCAQSGLPADT